MDGVPSNETLLAIEFARIAAIAMLYLLAIYGWGDFICGRLSQTQGDFPDYIASRLLWGCFGLYAVFILLSAVGLLHRMPVAVTLAVGLVFGLIRVRVLTNKLMETVGGTFQWSVGLRLLFAALCVLAMLQIACGFTPLIFYDSQIYQLLAPVQFLNSGSLVHIPWNVLSNGPMALQLTFGMSWIVDPTGTTFKLLMTLFGCLLLFAAARIGTEVGTQASIMSALLVASYPEFWVHQTLGVVDLPAASFLLFGVFWLREDLRQQSWTRALQAGIAFGFVMASRYQGVVFVGWALLVVFIEESLRNRKDIARNLLKAAGVTAVAALMVAPWLIRNYAIFGNPVYPILHGWLGGGEWSAVQAAQLQREVTGPSLLQVSLMEKLIAPVNALLMMPSNGLFGMGLLLGTLVAIWSGYRELRLYAVLGIGGLVIWGLMHPVLRVELLRYNAVSLVLLLSCTGAILGSDRLREWKGVYVGAAIALGSVIIGLAALQNVIPVWQTLISRDSRVLLWRANVPSWDALEFANKRLDPAHDKILLIGETRAVWLKIPFIAPTAFNGPQLDEVFRHNAGPEAWLQRLHELGITHLLISFPEWERFQKAHGYFPYLSESPNNFTRWLQSLKVLFDDRQGTLLLSL